MICTPMLSVLAAAASSLTMLGGPPVEFRLQPLNSTGPFFVTNNEIHVQPGAQRIAIELRISDWDLDLNGNPRLGTFQIQFLPSTLSTGTAGTLSMAGNACTTSAQCSTLHGSGAGCSSSQCEAMFANIARPDWVFAGSSSLTAFDAVSADRFRYGATVTSGPGAADNGSAKYGGTLLLDVPANAEGTFTIEIAPTFHTFACSTAQPTCSEFLPAIAFPALIVIGTPAPGRCCFDIGPGTTQCQNGVLPSQCNAQPPPRIFTEGATCAQGCPACVGDQDCDDELFCNGQEICVAGACQNGSPPVCDDQDACTIDFCNTGTDACDAAPDPKCPETGSCCDAATQICLDEVFSTECTGPQQSFSTTQACAQAGCAVHSGFLLLPVHSTGPYVVSGNAMTVLPGVQRVTLELFVSGWDPDLSGSPMLRTLQVAIPQTALTSGTSGALNRLNVPCANDGDCIAVLGAGAVCEAGLSKCHTMFGDMTRPDWVFQGIEALAAANSFFNPARVLYGATTLDLPGTVADSGAARYAGTLVLDATADAAGVFTVNIESTDTFWCEENSNCNFTIPALLPAIVSVDPAGLGACCFLDGSCEHATSATCAATYLGDGTTCDPNQCPQPTCGDGVVNQPSEECDVPDTSACAVNETCQPDCTCACACNGDVLVPHGPVIQFQDVAHVIDCAAGVLPPASCQADDINCDGQVTHCDVGVALRQFNGFPGGCEIPCGACCQEDGCLHEQQYLCDGDPLLPQFAGQYQGDGTSCDACAPPPPLPSVSDRCHGGPNDGQICSNSGQCLGGMCQKTDRCDGGPQHGAPCASNADCAGGLCGTKSAYLSINPSTAALRGGSVASAPILAIQVTLVDLPEFPDCNGQVRWVGPPQSYLEDAGGGTFLASETQTLEFYTDWSAYANLHVFGDAVVPGSTYEVRMCSPGPICSGTPLSITTTVWGDVVAPFGAPFNPNFLDISSVLDKFRVLPTRLEKSRTQLQPNPPDPADPVNFLDISAAITSFKGKKFSDFYPGPSGCP